MSAKTVELLRQALALSVEERADLAGQLSVTLVSQQSKLAATRFVQEF
jgi:hypothetical protein